jgi:8-oxo-dGTP diphosphatase
MTIYTPESQEEADFLKSYDASKFPIITVTVDVVALYRREDKDWKVLLIERGNWPYKGSWALPGGFMDETENAATAAARELQEETHWEVMDCDLEALQAVTTPGRDPRGRCVTLPFVWFETEHGTHPRPLVKAGDDAVKAQWFKLKDAFAMDLAFDHKSILIDALALADLEYGIKRDASSMRRVK